MEKTRIYQLGSSPFKILQQENPISSTNLFNLYCMTLKYCLGMSSNFVTILRFISNL